MRIVFCQLNYWTLFQMFPLKPWKPFELSKFLNWRERVESNYLSLVDQVNDFRQSLPRVSHSFNTYHRLTKPHVYVWCVFTAAYHFRSPTTFPKSQWPFALAWHYGCCDPFQKTFRVSKSLLKLVLTVRIELTTFSLQVNCSTNWAMPANLNLAERTGLEPVISWLTTKHPNQLNDRSVFFYNIKVLCLFIISKLFRGFGIFGIGGLSGSRTLN